jgi:hypothetical protein
MPRMFLTHENDQHVRRAEQQRLKGCNLLHNSSLRSPGLLCGATLQRKMLALYQIDQNKLKEWIQARS